MAAMLKLACVVLACMVAVAPYAAEGAISCDTVESKLTECLGYLKGGALEPGCCPAIKSLLAAVQTTSDRQAACNCVKNKSTEVPVNYGNAASLPSKCGIYIPYEMTQIRPSTDCTKYVSVVYNLYHHRYSNYQNYTIGGFAFNRNA
ncbi:hypothetical protein MKX01_032340 [Papaver californicum]|nr:hypothetical protein MKX01_032340 [Papaver californicum]